jgi:hypothetical protein
MSPCASSYSRWSTSPFSRLGVCFSMSDMAELGKSAVATPLPLVLPPDRALRLRVIATLAVDRGHSNAHRVIRRPRGPHNPADRIPHSQTC